MGALNILKVALPQQAPQQLPEDTYHAVNDLYLQFHNLVQQLNSTYPVMMSPDGHYWAGSINNSGVPIWTDLGTSPP